MPQTEPYVASYGPKPCQGWGPKFGVENWFKSEGGNGSNLRPWTLRNCVRGLQNRGFRILGNRANSAPKLAPCGGPWGAKWHQFGGSGAMSKAGLFPGASKGPPDAHAQGGGTPWEVKRGQGEEDNRRRAEHKQPHTPVDPKGSADLLYVSPLDHRAWASALYRAWGL